MPRSKDGLDNGSSRMDGPDGGSQARHGSMLSHIYTASSRGIPKARIATEANLEDP